MKKAEIEKARLAHNEYMRSYRKANRERIKLIDTVYWVKKSQEQIKKGEIIK